MSSVGEDAPVILPTVNVEVAQQLPQDAPKRERAQAYQDFAHTLLQIDRTLDFKMALRDWCYHLEESAFALAKSDFDRAERAINTCRDLGLLPIDFIAADDVRKPWGTNPTFADGTIDDGLQSIFDSVLRTVKYYEAEAYAEFQPVYLEVMVEKIGLRNMFESLCDAYHVLISNGRGDTDYISRANMMVRFADALKRGQRVILLYCGDFDPKGLLISDGLQGNFVKLNGTRFRSGNVVNCPMDSVEIIRFGLDFDFINTHLPHGVWTDNLLTGSDKVKCVDGIHRSGIGLDNPLHPDHNKPYVQRYLQAYCTRDKEGHWQGRKCEANALVVRPKIGRKLLEDVILQYVDLDGLKRYEASTMNSKKELCERLPAFLREQMNAVDWREALDL